MIRNIHKDKHGNYRLELQAGDYSIILARVANRYGSIKPITEVPWKVLYSSMATAAEYDHRASIGSGLDSGSLRKTDKLTYLTEVGEEIDLLTGPYRKELEDMNRRATITRVVLASYLLIWPIVMWNLDTADLTIPQIAVTIGTGILWIASGIMSGVSACSSLDLG